MPRRKKEEQPQEEIKRIKTPPIVDGMRDVLPSEERYWLHVENELRSAIHDYSFSRMETPLLEKYELFNHTLFKQNGALENEAFSFIDRGQKLILRPEATSSVMRSFIQHNMVSQQQPIKVCSWGPVFRQARGEMNKQRQFTQTTFEILGDKAPAIDAELIILSSAILKNLGLETEVRLNSIGCSICRLEYKKALSGYLKSKRAALCGDCRKRLGKDPTKFLACDNAKCQHLREDAPQTVDWLCDDCRNHLFRVLEYLDEQKISYRLDSSLMRTFDYYMRTIFEIVPAGDEADKMPLAAGGRYDYLSQMLDGPSVPAAGFSFGLERIINRLKTAKVEIPPLPRPDVFIAQISEAARQKSFAFLEKLRHEHFTVKANFSKSNLKAQLDQAIKLGARFVLILGQKEVSEGTVLLRDVDSGIQEVINAAKVLRELKKRIKEIRLKGLDE